MEQFTVRFVEAALSAEITFVWTLFGHKKTEVKQSEPAKKEKSFNVCSIVGCMKLLKQ